MSHWPLNANVNQCQTTSPLCNSIPATFQLSNARFLRPNFIIPKSNQIWPHKADKSCFAYYCLCLKIAPKHHCFSFFFCRPRYCTNKTVKQSDDFDRSISSVAAATATAIGNWQFSAVIFVLGGGQFVHHNLLLDLVCLSWPVLSACSPQLSFLWASFSFVWGKGEKKERKVTELGCHNTSHTDW